MLLLILEQNLVESNVTLSKIEPFKTKNQNPFLKLPFLLTITRQRTKSRNNYSNSTYLYKTGHCLAPNDIKELIQSENHRRWILDRTTTSRNYRRRSRNNSRKKARNDGIVGMERSKGGGELDRQAIFLGYKLRIGTRLLIHSPLSPPTSCPQPQFCCFVFKRKNKEEFGVIFATLFFNLILFNFFFLNYI